MPLVGAGPHFRTFGRTLSRWGRVGRWPSRRIGYGTHPLGVDSDRGVRRG